MLVIYPETLIQKDLFYLLDIDIDICQGMEYSERYLLYWRKEI